MKPRSFVQTLAVTAVIAGMGFAEIVFATPEAAPESHEEVADFLKMDVKSDSKMEGADVGFQIENGIAILTGTAISLDQAERAVARALASPGVRAAINQIQISSTGKSDADAKKAIKAALTTQQMVEANKVQVAVMGNRAVLTGEVGSWDEQELVREVVSGVPGIAAIENRLEVSFDSVRTDSQIQEQLGLLISNDPLYDGLGLVVRVKEGVARLNGEVGSRGEYNRLIRKSYVTGIIDVEASDLSVNTDLAMEVYTDKNFSSDETLAAIKDAFALDNRFDGRKIQVDFKEGFVALKGDVPSLAASDAAESTARNVPGVLGVSNRLKISGGQDLAAQNAELADASTR